MSGWKMYADDTIIYITVETPHQALKPLAAVGFCSVSTSVSFFLLWLPLLNFSEASLAKF